MCVQNQKHKSRYDPPGWDSTIHLYKAAVTIASRGTWNDPASWDETKRPSSYSIVLLQDLPTVSQEVGCCDYLNLQSDKRHHAFLLSLPIKLNNQVTRTLRSEKDNRFGTPRTEKATPTHLLAVRYTNSIVNRSPWQEKSRNRSIKKVANGALKQKQRHQLVDGNQLRSIPLDKRSPSVAELKRTETQAHNSVDHCNDNRMRSCKNTARHQTL